MTSKLLCSFAALLVLASIPACSSCNPTTTPRGSVLAAWSITVRSQPIACARVGAASVSLLLHNRASGADVTSTFACTDAQDTTAPVAAGAYDATLTLHTIDGAILATAPTQAGITVRAAQVVALAPVVFAVSNRGKLVLSLGARTASTNCLPPSQGGAGITGSVITLERAAGGCAPVTFVRSRGNTTLGTYTVVCSSPQVVSCIERDESLTVDGIDSGSYAIHVGGLIGPIRCWVGDDALSVPAGASLVKAIDLAPQQAAGC
jgi:hypothetical protein